MPFDIAPLYDGLALTETGVINSKSWREWFTKLTVTGGVIPSAHASTHQSGGSDTVNHDLLVGFVSDEHVSHSSVSVSAGTGLTGGGDISANRTISLDHLGIEDLTDPGADRIYFWDDSETKSDWLTVSTGLQISGTNLTTDDSAIDHDALLNFVANEHIDWTNASESLVTTGDITCNDLTVSGTLDVNMTEASVPFIDAAGALTENNDGIYYDNSAKIFRLNDTLKLRYGIATPIYSQTFEAYAIGTDLTGEGWTKNGAGAGTFEVSAGKYGFFDTSPTTWGGTYTLDAGSAWDNFQVVFDVKSYADRWIFAFRHNGSAAYYYLHIPGSNIARLYKAASAMPTSASLISENLSAPGSVSSVKIVASGTSIKLYIDDVLVDDTTDASYSTGTIGVSGYGDWEIDNIVVSDVGVYENIIEAESAGGITIQPDSGPMTINGNLITEPTSDSTTAVQFKNNAGTSIFSLDTTNSRVGINDTTPGRALDVTGDGRFFDNKSFGGKVQLQIYNSGASGHAELQFASTAGVSPMRLYGASGGIVLFGNYYTGMTYWDTPKDFGLDVGGNYKIIMGTNGVERLTITGAGGIEIGQIDNAKMFYGANQDMSISFNGSNGVINPREVGANNLVVNSNFIIGTGVAATDYTLTFDGETNDGLLTWMEDEDYFKFGDNVNIDTLTASKPVWTDANKTLVSKDITACDITRTAITPTTQTVTTGTLTAGTVTDVQTWSDGNEVNVSEVAGIPGFDVRYTFASVANFCEIGISAYYNGSATHNCEVQIYDDTNAVWKLLFSFPGNGLAHNYRFANFPDIANVSDYINGGDQVIIRFYHPQTGNASHDLYVDYVSIIGTTT